MSFGNDALSVGSGGLLGDNPISRALGLSGAQGNYFKANNSNAALDTLNAQNAGMTGDAANAAVKGYASGGKSLADVLATNTGSSAGDIGARQALATDPSTGSKMATDQVQSNPILGQLFGNGGELSNSVNTEQNLQNQGYSLQPQDISAYGQASGNIARMFGQSENSAAQSLADRGLSQGPNGATGATFSGLQGNKNEMLSQAQTNIANARMQNTMQRIGQQQQFISQLGNQANTAINDQYGRNITGVKTEQGDLQNTANLQVAQNNGENSANLASMQDQRGAQGKTLFNALGSGLYSGVAGVASKAPAMAAGGPAGAASAAAPAAAATP